MKAKSPLTEHGFFEATQDLDQIYAWWRRWPDALAGVPTGGERRLVVLDYDEPKADSAAREWLEAHTNELLTTRTHQTMSGGRHYLFRGPEGQQYRGGVCLELAGVKRTGIDLRAEGGYIIWWPLHGAIATGEIAPLPAGLLDERRVERRDLAPLSPVSPDSWARDRETLIEILPYLDPADYDPWIDAGMAIHLASGGSDAGFTLWHDWSKGEITGETPVKYAGLDDCRYRWASFVHDKGRDKLITIGSLVHNAKAKGYVRVARDAPLPADIPESAEDAESNPPVDVYEKDEPGTAGLSDDELALLFTARHCDELRYVAAWDRWLIWDGKRWGHDEKKRVFDLARKLCRDVLGSYSPEQMTAAQWNGLRKRLGDARTVYNVTKLAGADPRHAVAVAELDADPWRLNTPAGIIDLRTGMIEAHSPAALHTKITAAAPAGGCPVFLKILRDALPEDELRAYVRRLFGYAMSGSCRDHALSFWWGSGRNGKGTIAHAFRRALGDYALEVGAELFMESHHERHPTEIAVLRGARFVVASEIDTGRRWNEARLKRLTGGDPISARYIGKDLFEFEPTHTLLIIGNTKPGLRSVDEAMRARMQLVEFRVTIEAAKRDTALSEKLAAEYGGILAWALEGCAEWQKIGLAPPADVLMATSAYLDAEDSIEQWMNECCDRSGFIKLSSAHRSYRDWCEQNASPSLGRNAFADQLCGHGVARNERKDGKLEGFVGISLKTMRTRMDADDAAEERMQQLRNNRYS